jgi:hypothetical protein
MNEPESCPPQKRAAATKAPRRIATRFCRGLSVPCSSGRRGHVSIQTAPLLSARHIATSLETR